MTRLFALYAALGGLNIGLWIADRFPADNPTHLPLVVGVVLLAWASLGAYANDVTHIKGPSE